MINDKRVSRRHAVIYSQSNTGQWLVDFGSSNGVFVNNRRVTEPVQLKDQDRIDIAGHVFTYRDNARPTAPPSTQKTADFSDKTEMLPRTFAATGQGIVFLTTDGQVQFISERAMKWLGRYFPDMGSDKELPESLKKWINRQPSVSTENNPLHEPFIVRKEGRQLQIRFEADNRAQQWLLLSEQTIPGVSGAAQSAKFTERELDILRWIAQGKSNNEIAIILDMNVRTVHKHVEHIYQKLEVENRPAAVVRAMEYFGLTPG